MITYPKMVPDLHPLLTLSIKINKLSLIAAMIAEHMNMIHKEEKNADI